MNRRFSRLVAVGAVVALMAAACGSDDVPATQPSTPDTPAQAADPEPGFVIDGEEIADAELWAAAQAEGNLLFYTGLTEVVEIDIAAAFQEATGISIDIIRLAPGALLERIMSEFGANQLDADLIALSNIGLLQQAKESGVFEAYCHPYLDLYPETTSDADCTFFPRSNNFIALAVNTAVIETMGLDAPQDWQDLLDPQWNGLIGASHIGVGGAAWSFWKMARDVYGLEYWEGLATQNIQFSGSAAATVDAVARGEIAIAIASPLSPTRRISEGAPMEVLIPSVVPVYHNYLSLSATAKNPNAAKVFINWMASPHGQQVLADVGGGHIPASAGGAGPLLAGVRQPALSEMDTEVFYAEGDETYVSLFEAWSNEWFRVFNYTP